MIYQYTLTVTAGSTQNNPSTGTLKITHGLIYRVQVEFPAGCAGEVSVQVYRGGHLIYPSSSGKAFVSSAQIIDFEDTLLVLAAPYELYLRGWAPNASYNHNIAFRIGMVSKKVFMARFLPSYSYEYFQEMIQTEQARQEQERQARVEEAFAVKEET